MDPIEVLLVAIGLSMDACAVSIGRGAALSSSQRVREVLIMALFFGLFQALMPIVGWYIGSSFAALIESVDHWIAALLLAVIGGRMIHESLSGEEKERSQDLPLRLILILALATSIDALAVGIGLAVLDEPILVPAALIGGVTFIVSLAGGLLGSRLGEQFGRRMEVVGGIVLIGIGLRILVSHMIA